MIKGVLNDRLQRHLYDHIFRKLLRNVYLIGKNIPVSLPLYMKIRLDMVQLFLYLYKIPASR